MTKGRIALSCVTALAMATGCRLPGATRQMSLEATVAAQATQIARLSQASPAAAPTVAPAHSPTRTPAPIAPATATPPRLTTTPARPIATRTPTARPTPTTTPAPDFSPFAKYWGAHGFSLVIGLDGTGEGTWRVGVWCGDVPPGRKIPCDRVENNMIYSGGHAKFRFQRVQGDTVHGQAMETTDPDSIPNGPVWLRLEEYGMAMLGVGADEFRTLCGPDFADVAPPEVLLESPCGA